MMLKKFWAKKWVIEIKKCNNDLLFEGQSEKAPH